MASPCRSADEAAASMLLPSFLHYRVGCVRRLIPANSIGFRIEMFPDLRLLISATVATFFLAAMAGLYASLPTTQDQITARAESRAALDDSPITRISDGGRRRSRTRSRFARSCGIATASPPDLSEPARRSTDRGEMKAVAEPEQSSAPATIDAQPQASLNRCSRSGGRGRNRPKPPARPASRRRRKPVPPLRPIMPVIPSGISARPPRPAESEGASRKKTTGGEKKVPQVAVRKSGAIGQPAQGDPRTLPILPIR